MRRGAIHDDCLKTLAGKFLDGGIGVGAVLDTDFHLAEDATKDADDLLVSA